MAIVQAKLFNPAESPAAPSAVVAFDNPVTTGNCIALLFVCSYGGGRGTFSVVGDDSVALSEAVGSYVNGGFANLNDTHGFYRANHPGGATSFTVSTTENDFQNFKAYLVELSGIAVSGALVDAKSNVQDPSPTSSDGVTSTELTISESGTEIVGITWDADRSSPGSGTLSAGTGYSGLNSGAIVAGEHRAVSPAANTAATFSHSVAGVHLTSAMAFKPAGVAPVRAVGLDPLDNVSSTTVNINTGANFTAGNTGIFAVLYYSPNNTKIVSATIGGTAADILVDNGASGNYVAILKADAIAGGSPTVSLTFANSTGRFFTPAAMEFGPGEIEFDPGVVGFWEDSGTGTSASVSTSAPASTADSIVVGAVVAAEGSLNMGFTPPAGYNNLLTENNSEDHQGGNVSWVQSAGTGIKTVTWGISNNKPFKAAVAVFKVTGGSGTPGNASGAGYSATTGAPSGTAAQTNFVGISNVSKTAFVNGETGIVMTVSGASASGNRVVISPTDDIDDESAVTQTITAEGTTSVTFTAVRGSLALSTDFYLFIENTSGYSNLSGYPVRFRPGSAVITDTLVGSDNQPLADLTDIRILVYRLGRISGAPDQEIEGQETDEDGVMSVSINVGALEDGDPVFYFADIGNPPTAYTCGLVVPTYS